MVLLTSSSISVLISSSVIFLFTFFLFLSGYVLQQQTVRNLQAALHPPPTPSVSVLRVYPETYTVDGKRRNGTEVPMDGAGAEPVAKNGEGKGTGKVEVMFGSPPGSTGYRAFQDAIRISGSESNLESKTSETIQMIPADLELESLREAERWKDLAYVQILEDPSDICSSLLFFKTLSRQQSEIPGRIVIYPSTWSAALSSQNTFNNSKLSSSTAATALLALKNAKEPLGLTLQPVDIPSTINALSSTLVAAPFLLPNYKRLMYVRRNGLLLNTTTLDETLAASPLDDLDLGIAAVGSKDEMASLSLFLIRPSEKTREWTTAALAKVNTESVDAAFESLVTAVQLEVPILELREGGGATRLVAKLPRDEGLKDAMTGGEEEAETSYVQFSKQEVEEGTTMEERGGMWWDGLMRYRKGVREVCEALDLGEEGKRKGEDDQGGKEVEGNESQR